jgi:nitroreductase
MKYSMMDFMTIDNNFFSKRRSVTAKKMVSGKVPDSDIQQILAAGIRVPDHGALNPWKLIVIKGDSLVRIDNEIILSEFKKENPDADENKLRIESSRLQRASAVIAVLSTPLDHPTITKWEMQLSSAAVCMNLLNCTQSMGYAAQWITEWYAYNNKMLTELGGRVGIDKISGFIYIGTKNEEPSERRRPDPDKVINYI